MRRPELPLLPALLAGLLILSGCSKQARRDRVMADANKDFAAGDYRRAEVEYRKALVLVAMDPEAIRQLGLLYHEQGRFGMAYQYLKKATELTPADTDTAATLAQDALVLGSVKRARDGAREVLNKAPRQREALVLMAETCRSPQDVAQTRDLIAQLQKGGDAAGFHLALGLLDLASQPKDAEAEFRRALALEPQSPDAHAGLANVALRNRDLKTAGTELQAAADLSSVRSTWRLRQIEFLIQTGQTAPALQKLDELTDKAPDFVSAWLVKMKLALAQRRYDDCAAAIRQVISLDPRNFEALIEKGTLALARNDAPAAIDAFKDVDKDFPKVPLVQYQLAMSYLRNRDATQAEQRLNTALKLEPAFVPATMTLAELEISRGNSAGAADRISRLLDRQPRVEQAYLLLGRALVAQKNYEGALKVFERMAQVFPRDPQAPFHSGEVYVQLKKPAEARRSFNQAVALSPSFGPALESLINLDLADKHMAAARQRVSDLISRYPKSPGPWLLQAKIDLNEKNVAAAKTSLQKAIDLDPNNSTAYMLLSRIYLATRDTAAAEKELRILADKTKSAGALMQLASLHFAQKRYTDAKAEFLQVLAINPHFVPAMNDLAALDIQYLNNPAEAETYAREAREQGPDDPNAARVLGWVLMKKGAIREGLPLLQESADQLPADGDAQFRLGVAFYTLGNEDSAKTYLHKALALNPESGDVAEIKSRLAWLELDISHPDAALRAKLEQRVKDQPNDTVALSRLADVEARLGDASAAAEHYRTEISLIPGNPRVLMALAELEAGPLKSPADAMVHAKAAHELAPTDPQISLALGRLAAHAGDYAWSLDLLQQASRGLPDDATLSYDLAWAYYRMGRLSEAQSALENLPDGGPHAADAARLRHMTDAAQDLNSAAEAEGQAKQILKGDAHYLPAEMVAAMAAEKNGKSDEAADGYSAILAQDPAFFPASRRLAIADYALGKYSETVRLFKDTERQGRLDGQSLYYYGMGLYRLKDKDASKSQLQRALAAGLTDSQSAEARRALRELRQSN